MIFKSHLDQFPLKREKGKERKKKRVSIFSLERVISRDLIVNFFFSRKKKKKKKDGKTKKKKGKREACV